MHWTFLDSAEVPDGGELRLYQRGGHYMIRTAGTELMASHNYASEEALASLACQRVGRQRRVRFLIGGLGMGYTLAAALRQLRADAEVVVAELVPDVVRWNREHFGHLASFPLEDERVRLHEGDVAQLMRRSRGEFDAILLDVDNGPEGLTREKNDWLYGNAGLHNARMALRTNGLLAVWSAGNDDTFSARLRRAGFEIEVCGGRKQPDQKRRTRHVIWLATPCDEPQPEPVRRQQSPLARQRAHFDSPRPRPRDDSPLARSRARGDSPLARPRDDSPLARPSARFDDSRRR